MRKQHVNQGKLAYQQLANQVSRTRSQKARCSSHGRSEVALGGGGPLPSSPRTPLAFLRDQ